MNYDDKMDPECVTLCDALNRVRGIHTIESCCGHGERPFRVWFTADCLTDLPRAIYYFDACHSGRQGWRVLVTTDCAMSPVHFMVEGPVGQQAYSDAAHIAAVIVNHLPPPPPQPKDIAPINITDGLSSEEHVRRIREGA